MSGTLRFARATRVASVAALLIVGAQPAVAQTTDRYQDRPLAEALRVLQAKGLPIVFSSATVTSDMRVRTEPRGTTARQLLDEILAPHGLQGRDGPGGVIQVVRAEPDSRRSPTRTSPEATGTIEGRVIHALTDAPLAGALVQVDGMTLDARTDAAGRFIIRAVQPGVRTVQATVGGFMLATRAVQVTRASKATVTLSLLPATSTHSEHVTVRSPRPYRQDRGVASEMMLERGDFEATAGLLDDPMRAVHSLPHVSVVDDFRSDFSVRGSPFRHVGVVVDGVATPWLHHTAVARGATGSLTMLTSQVLEMATLRVGAYPHRFGDRLGAELEMKVREGSRERFALRGSLGGSNATIVAEGPVGPSGDNARGSWIVAARQSYLEWPPVRADAARTPFGFADGLAKVVYDLRPDQKIGFSLLGGVSNVDGEESLVPGMLEDGTNRTTVANVFWRSTPGSSLVVTHRAYVVKHRYWNSLTSGIDAARGTNDQFVYRADVARRMWGGLLEMGAQVGRASGMGAGASADDAPAPVGGRSSWERSGFAHFAWTITPALSVSPGVRVTQSSLWTKPMAARWVLAEYALGSGWSVNASTGASRQLPELHQAVPSSRPERATHVDIAVEQRVGKTGRWQATLFNRNEADLLREPDLTARLAGDSVVDPPDPGAYTNSLSGSSRGVELLVSRQGPARISGWVAYSYGRTRYADAVRNETFWADFDQRHTLSVVGQYQFPERTNVAATFRAGSGFPIPAYLSRRRGILVVGDRRNDVRLPAYARLDIRASRGLETLGRRVTVFVEVANVLDRANVGLARGSIRPTGEAVGFTDTLQRRRTSAGVVVQF